ncbi:YfhO family protein [Puia sp.]|uniref:YfhO family protein n=1 Tax=Puia sp. TaxID=2045100 RepID=UPI002F3EF9D0
MQKSWYRPLIPHAIAIGVFILVALIYCSPILEHKTLAPGDTAGWKAMAQNSFEYKATHDHFPLWTESLHSGMPAYQVAMDAPSFSPQYLIYKVITFGLPNPAGLFLLACICFYILALALGLNPYVGMITGLAYAYSTYNPSILVVGHSTKMYAIAVMPAFLASLILLYEKKYWLGTVALALFTALYIAANHPQILYYGLIAAGFMTLAYLLRWIKEKDYKHLGKVVVLGAIGGLLGIACNAVVIFTTADYAKASLRGGSDLATPGGAVTKTGLSQDYALSYSMYKTEAFTLLVPKIYGGSDYDPQITADDSKTMNALQSMPQQLAQQLSPNSYWGGIGTTAGPAYAGAVIVLFALLGFFLLDGKHKWWILAAAVVTLMMSWGMYFLSFNSFLLKVLPAYNKFRAPSVIIVVPTLLLVVLAALTLNRLLTMSATDRTAAWKQYKKGLYLVGGIFVLLFILYSSFDYAAESDSRIQQAAAAAPTQIQDYIRTFIHALRQDRQSLFLSSLLRSLFYVAIAAGIGFLWLKNRLKPLLALGIIGALTLVDLFTIDVQYLSADKYVDEEEAQTPFQPTAADQQIMADKSYYRVFDLRYGGGPTITNVPSSYFHHSIAGYHPAKLSIYQDLLENQLYKFPNCQPVLDMLNTKYILLPAGGGRDSAERNPGALGPVWLVRGLRFDDSSRAVMDALTTLDVKDTAVLFSTDRSAVPATALGTPGPADSIWLEKHDNDEMLYHSNTTAPRFAVFSEVYYNRGWHAYIDNTEAPILRTNYVLRGVAIPAGNHAIRFEFHPASYYTSRTIQVAASLILLALLIIAGIQTGRNKPSAVKKTQSP